MNMGAVIPVSKDDMLSLMEPLAELTGTDFFAELVRRMAELLDVDYAFVGEFDPVCNPGKILTRAVWAKGQPAPDFAYDLLHSPCHEVVSGGLCLYPSRVMDSFPNDDLLQDMGVQGYGGVPLRDSGGQVIGLLVVLRDDPLVAGPRVERVLRYFAGRTSRELERIRVVEALRASQERVQLVLEGADLGTWDWSVPDGRMEFSARWAEIVGYEPGEISADRSSWELLVHPEDLPEVLQALEAHLAGKTPFYETEHRRLHKDGHWVWVLDRGRVLERDDEGSPLRACGTHLDISDRKRAEQERARLHSKLLETQKLESLGVLAGGIAHDFSNLLMSIMGNADLALADVDPTSQAADCLQHLLTGARRAGDLCRQLLAYSGRGRFRIDQLHLGEVVVEILEMLHVSISKKATLQLDVAEELPRVEADATQIRQLLVNLVYNASESLGEDPGTISIVIDAVELDAHTLRTTLRDVDDLSPGRYVRIVVTDTGCGMDDETRQRLFEPFFTTKFTGRGLGMAAALGIVRGHRGAIRVSSEPGVGTTFEIHLPAQDGEPSADPASQSEEDRLLGGIALLVDDEVFVRRVAARMLERLGFEVIPACNGLEALEIFRERQEEIAVVLLDLTMPVLDGAQTLGELRKLDPKVRVLLTSGYSEQEAVNRAAAHGPASFIQKPYRMDALREHLLAVLKGTS